MKTEKVIWGLILIFIGAVFLLNNFGVIDFYWGSVWRFWPIIFILIGANMLFSRLNGSTGSILSVSLTLAALIFLGYQGTREPERRMGRSWFKFDHDWDNDSRDTVRSNASWTSSNTFTESYSANTDRAELNIKGGATSYRLVDTTSNLFNAEVKQNFGNYTLEKTTRDSVEVLNFRMRNKKQKWEDMDGNEVKIKLNSNPLWDINVEMGAGETDFDLTSFKIANLQLNGGAASFKVKLPEPVTTTNVTVETGVAEVDIRVPEASACRITVESGLSSKDFSGFIKQADGSYETSNYNTAAKKIDINLKGGLSSFEVSRY